MKFKKSDFAYLLLVGFVFAASCGVPGPPLPPIATTPEESDRRDEVNVQPSPLPSPPIKQKTKKR